MRKPHLHGSQLGYSHLQPITSGGKLVGACLIVVGAGLFSTLCGTIASWMLVVGSQKPHEDESRLLAETLTHINEELREVKMELSALKEEAKEKEEDVQA